MAWSLAQFHKHLAGDTLRSAYLLAGEEHLLLLEAADALRARARALGYVERDILDADARFDWDDLARSAAGMSLFATRKLIDLRLPTGKPGKDGSSTIQDYCNNPPPDTVLLITCNEWSKRHEGAWTEAIENAGAVVPIWSLKLDELPSWISQRMAARSLSATPEAIEALIERTEGNLLAAAQEIDKLSLLAAGKKLDAATLEDLVADSAHYDVFKLADAALSGDAERALRILAGLRGEGEAVPGLLGWLLNQLQLMARLASAANSAQAFRNERIWPAREGIYRRALQRADRQHWERCLAQAARVDALSKGRGRGDAWVEFERLLAAMALPRAPLLVGA
jgi:DNA polymerase-3 subunit delta